MKIILITFALTFILTACGVQPTPVLTEVTPAPEITTPVTLNTPTTAATEQPTPTNTEMTSQSEATLFRIVAGESKLQYEVGEVLFNQNNRFNLAVGVTTQVSGEILVNLVEPQKSSLGTITADISQFTSDNSRRDNALRSRFIETNRYPTVTFIASEIIGLPDTYQTGQAVTLQISGDLTIRETTRPIKFDTLVSLEDNTLTGEATTTILMSDFGFGPIDLAGILKTEDEAKVTLSFIARP